ncbi:MAG: alanine:cation symporter family protein, partial [Rikenellaceae bacterium]
ETSSKKHSVSSFQAFCISTASRVGVGNLAGIATAIAIGGAGSIFWMWIIALIGSASGFVESTLAQIFKRKSKDSFIGGPAYYMQYGLKKRWFGVIFAVLITVTFGFIFNSVQANTISLAFNEAFGVSRTVIGIVVTIFSQIVIFGGIHRIAIVSSVLVPIMAIIYILLAIFIVVTNIEKLPHVFELIFSQAFGFQEFAGGTVGAIAGSLLGPVGTLIGGMAGAWVGDKLGSTVAPYFKEWTDSL